MKNTKGLSTIVATLIIILLVLVAVGIIWVVVRSVIEGGTEDISGKFDCTNVIVRPTKVVCAPTAYLSGNDGVCDVTYTRAAGGENIGGIKIILSDGDQNFIEDVPNNVPELATRTQTGITTGFDNVTRVDTAVYFLDASGTEVICDASGYFDVQLPRSA